jgi:hypothetical protein
VRAEIWATAATDWHIRSRVSTGEYLARVLLGGDGGDVDVMLAEVGDAAGGGEVPGDETLGVVIDAVQRAKPQDKS